MPGDQDDSVPIGAAGADPTERPPELVERVPLGLVFRWAAAGTLGVLVVLLTAYGLYVVRDVLVLVMIALFVAVSLDPAIRWLIRHKVHRSYAVAIVVTAMLVLFGIFVWSVVPPLVEQGTTLFGNLPRYVRDLPDKSRTLRELSARYDLTAKLSDLATTLPAKVASSAIGFMQQFFGVLVSILTVLVLSIYFMADMPRLRRGLVRLFPHRRRPQVAEVVNVVVDKVGAYMIGNLIISFFAGITSFLCLEVVGVPYALPLAILVAITDLIPMVGATLGAAMCVLVTLFTADFWPVTVVVLIFFIVYQQLENYVIAPRVLRNTVDLSSVAVLLCALVGGTVLGVVGALMAIPIAAAVKAVIAPALEAMHQPPPPAEAVSSPPPAGEPRWRSRDRRERPGTVTPHG